MEKLKFCLFVPVGHEGYKVLRRRYVVEGGIFDLADNILGERGKVYLFDGEINITCDGEKASLPNIEPGTLVVLGEPAEENFGVKGETPEGDFLKVASVTRKAVGSRRMHHTVLTLK